MEPIVDQLNAIIPAKYLPWLTILYVLSTQLGRAAQALMAGRGIKGTMSAIWLGTNTPKAAPEATVTPPPTTH